MDNKKQIELIKLSTIGCISEEDHASLNSLMTEDENFLWNELGEFQNIIAMLPSALEIETPNWKLKDKVARKLYKIRDEVKSQQEERMPAEEITASSDQLVEEPEEGVTIDESELDVKESDIIEIPQKEKIPAEPIPKTKPGLTETTTREPIDKELIKRTTKEYVSKSVTQAIESTQKNIKKSFFLSLALFLILLLLIAFMYFKFSGDLDSKQEEIDVLKKRLGISSLEIETENISSL